MRPQDVHNNNLVVLTLLVPLTNINERYFIEH